ncbi:methylated-DNA--[protein]-cysteine S-methyltransferase [Microbacterium stercoris]|uniref:methylated-DNA--[protein]-cysteine S-methyltransferase n=1 Tax=Microbacterium stercoris TaxID=2820289 RepID=UPI0027DB9F70|nr:methylated-DNA--[protein]-cysteine S-methyltransferase [Microbacterium stercoris]
MTLRYDLGTTPIGLVTAVFSDTGLLALHVADDTDRWVLEMLAQEHGVVPDHQPGSGAALFTQLDEYFAGSREAFDVEIDWGLTQGFARDALQEIRRIPYGETAAYGEIAERAGRPRAHRAVGTACRTTPFSIVVPVHRVIRSDGSLGEYGGRPENKRFLIDLENGVSPSLSIPPRRSPNGDDF